MTIKMMSPRKPADQRKAAAFIAGKTAPSDKKTVVNLRLDSALLAQIDADAKRRGVSRTAWLSMTASKAFE